MTQHLKTVLWFNIAIAIFFILSYSNVEFFECNLLRGVLTFVHELFLYSLDRRYRYFQLSIRPNTAR